MLKMKYLFENFPLAKLALQNYAYNAERLDESLSWFRISANAVYPFFDEGGLCFLRLAPDGERTREGIQAELDFIDYLRQNGYPAMEPIKTKDGQTLITLDTEWGVWHACAFRRVEGTQLEDAELSDEALYDYGAALGWLHALSEGYKPENRRQDYQDLLKWTGDVLEACGVPACMINEASDVKAALDALPRDKGVYGLVHYDFETDNVFYDPERRVCAAIDFDDCAYHWYALDLEQAFDSLGERFEDEQQFAAAKAQFMRGYRSRHAFTEDMEKSMPLMRRFIDLYGYARIRHCLSEPMAQRPDWLVNLEGILMNKAGRIERKVAQRQAPSITDGDML